MSWIVLNTLTGFRRKILSVLYISPHHLHDDWVSAFWQADTQSSSLLRSRCQITSICNASLISHTLNTPAVQILTTLSIPQVHSTNPSHHHTLCPLCYKLTHEVITDKNTQCTYEVITTLIRIQYIMEYLRSSSFHASTTIPDCRQPPSATSQ